MPAMPMTPPADTAPLLQVQDLDVRFLSDSAAVHAVRGLSYEVRPGEILAIVGESGSGKSVSSLAVMGLLPDNAQVTARQLRFAGQDLLGMAAADKRALRGRDIGMIFQDPMTALNPVITVGEQLMEPLRIHLGMTPAQARERACELMGLVGISEANTRLDQYPHQFSGGMRQRVMIAIGLACNPRLLIADEPTTALDVTIQAQILELVKDLRQKLGMAIIWITHDLGVIAGIADRVMVMYGGQVVEQAPVKELFGNPQHPYTRALLKTIPKLGGAREARLQAIEGQPPILSAPPTACAFRSRCPLAFARCDAENPLRRPVDGKPLGAGHDAACHLVGQPAEPAHA